MENKNLLSAVVWMPSNRVAGFEKQIPSDCKKHMALISGIRCREEAFVIQSQNLQSLLKLFEPYPKNAAIRFFLPMASEEASEKICSFTLQFEEEPQLYAVWCQCGKVVAGLSIEEVKMLRFSLWEDKENKQVHFQAYAKEPSDKWVQLMLNFAHNIQPDEQEWVASEIKFESCSVMSNF